MTSQIDTILDEIEKTHRKTLRAAFMGPLAALPIVEKSAADVPALVKAVRRLVEDFCPGQLYRSKEQVNVLKTEVASILSGEGGMSQDVRGRSEFLSPRRVRIAD